MEGERVRVLRKGSGEGKSTYLRTITTASGGSRKWDVWVTGNARLVRKPEAGWGYGGWCMGGVEYLG